MTGTTEPTNIERLRAHLAENSLAAKLLDTYRNVDPVERGAALKRIAETRLTEIRAALTTPDVPPDASD